MQAGANKEVPLELEIAWARAVSRAAEDPAFGRRLRDDARGVLEEEFGVDVPEIDFDTQLTPGLSQALDTIEKQHKLVRAAQRQGCQSSLGTVGCSYVASVPMAQPVIAAYPVAFYASIHPHTHVAPPPAAVPFYASAQPHTHVSPPPAAVPFYASAQPHTHASPSPPPAPLYASIQPYTSGGHAYASAPWASLYASQVATTRAVTVPGPIPPQRLGGPPSGGVLAMW